MLRNALRATFVTMSVAVAMLLSPAGAHAHDNTATHGESTSVVFSAAGSCVTATLIVQIKSIPVGNWSWSWDASNDTTAGWDDDDGSVSNHLVVLSESWSGTAYSACFASGVHGYLTVSGVVWWNDTGSPHTFWAACHWGHGAGCV